MRPSTFAAIERSAARSGARDPEAVAGAAYWKTLAARYRGNPISEEPDPKYPGEMRFVEWRRAMLGFINSHWYGGTLSNAEIREIQRLTGMPSDVVDWSFIRDAEDDQVIATFLYVQSRHPELGPHRGFNPSKLEQQRAARGRASRIRGARLNPPRFETVLYGIPKGKTERYEEVLLLTNATPESIERVKTLASKDGFHSFRVAKIDLSIPPDFRKAVRGNPSILDEIRHGDKVTILVPSGIGREGQEYSPRTGTAVMRGPHGWVLNLGGRFGTPGVATESNIVKVRKVNPSKKERPKPRKGESVPDYHARRVREIVEKMPKPIRDVFDRNPASYKFIFRNPGLLDELREGYESAKAEALYEEFHGREPREILELTQSAEERGEYTGLGDLVELTIDALTGDVVLKFKDDGVRLASSPEGSQLYLLGGNQDISASLGTFGIDESKDLLDLGELKQLVYDAAKWQTDFTPQEWKHDLGEESGVRPRVFFDRLKKRIFFAGGNYRVERPGIVD